MINEVTPAMLLELIAEIRAVRTELLEQRKNNPDLPGRVLSFSEACKFVGFSKSYMYKMTSSGMIPFSKPGGKKLWFDREKLKEWMLSNETKTPEQKETEASTYVSTN